MTLFETIVTALELGEAYKVATEYYSQPSNLQATIENLGNLDDGNVLDSSLTNVRRFMQVTDALMDHINNNLDNITGADTMLGALLGTEIIAADCFVPKLRTEPSAKPGCVDVSCTGLGLTLSIFTSESHLDISRETLLDDILDEESAVVLSGRLTVYSDDTLHWSPYVEAPVDTSEPEIPTGVTADETIGVPYE